MVPGRKIAIIRRWWPPVSQHGDGHVHCWWFFILLFQLWWLEKSGCSSEGNGVKFGCVVIWRKTEEGNSIDQQTDSKPVDPTLRGPFYALLERLRARRVERSHWRKGAPWGGFYITVRVKKLEVQNTSQDELYFRTQDWIQDQRLVSQTRRRILFWSGSSKVC